MKAKHVLKTHRTTVVDHVTGEVQKDSTEMAEVIPIRYEIMEEPPFVKMYLNDLSNLVGLPKSLRPLLDALVTKIDFRGEISISTGFRERLCSILSISRQTLRNRLNMLTKHEIITSVGGSDYMVNPKYFAKGKWMDIVRHRQDFEMRIRYKKNGTKEVTTVGVDPEQQQSLL